MKTVKLGELTKITIGRTPLRGNDDFWDKKKVTSNVWLSIADLLNVDGKIVNDSKEYITDEAAQKFAIVPQGTLLVSFKLTLGRLAYAGRDLRTNEAIAALHNDEDEILNDYIYHYLSRFDWNNYAAADQKVKGLTLNKAKLAEIPIEYPESLEEQRRVVEKLDAAFERISAAEVLMRRNLDNVAALQKSILHKYLSADDSTHTHRLGDVCAIVSRLVDPKIMPFLDQLHVGAANIISNTGELIDLKTSKEEKLISGKFPFDNRMVLYSKIRPYLKKVVRPDFDGVCSADIYPLLPNDNLNRDYLYYLLTSADFTEYAIVGSQRAGMPKVNREHLFEYRFNLPTMDIQEKIVDKLNTALSKSRELESQYTKKLTKLTDLRQSLLQEAFSTTNKV